MALGARPVTGRHANRSKRPEWVESGGSGQAIRPPAGLVLLVTVKPTHYCSCSSPRSAGRERVMGISRLRGQWPVALLLTGTALTLAGCSGNSDTLSRTFGLTRDAPDEFMVTTRAPLSMPPDFSLRPPRPGAPRPMEQSERTQAEEALVPQTALGTPQGGDSAGQNALVQAAGPTPPAQIRQQVDSDARMQQADTSFVSKLLFWQTPPEPGTVVDPQKEAQRIRQNAALGESQDNGDTPIIQPRKKGLLEDLF
jgi:hypothetical protein